MASPFFFVDKKDGKLQPCQDYRYLNEHMVKNAYLLPLITELLDKLKGAQRFTKLDVDEQGACLQPPNREKHTATA